MTVGTIFQKTHVDLQRWFLLISLMLSATGRLSSVEAARDIEIRQPTVWSMMRRVRRAMVDDRGWLVGIVEGVTNKLPIVNAVERGGRVKRVGPARLAAQLVAA